MTRDNGDGTFHTWIKSTVGARGATREALLTLGIEYREDKASWFTSVFWFDATPAQMRVLYEWIRLNNL